MHSLQIAESDDALQFGKGGLAGLLGPQVVPGGEGVTGIDAYADAGFVLHAVDQIAQVFESESEIGTLPGGVFDDGRDAARLFERKVDRCGDTVETLLLGDLFQMAPRMEVQAVESEQFAAFHLVDECLPGLFERFGFGMPEVDQIGVVGQDLCRGVFPFVTGTTEGVDLGCREGLGHPLALVLGEECEGGGSDGPGVARGVLQSARCTDMCSEVFHIVRCFVLFWTKLRIL